MNDKALFPLLLLFIVTHNTWGNFTYGLKGYFTTIQLKNLEFNVNFIYYFQSKNVEVYCDKIQVLHKICLILHVGFRKLCFDKIC